MCSAILEFVVVSKPRVHVVNRAVVMRLASDEQYKYGRYRNNSKDDIEGNLRICRDSIHSTMSFLYFIMISVSRYSLVTNFSF